MARIGGILSTDPGIDEEIEPYARAGRHMHLPGLEPADLLRRADPHRIETRRKPDGIASSRARPHACRNPPAVREDEHRPDRWPAARRADLADRLRRPAGHHAVETARREHEPEQERHAS